MRSRWEQTLRRLTTSPTILASQEWRKRSRTLQLSKCATVEELVDLLNSAVPVYNSVPSPMEKTFRLLVVADLLVWALFVLATMVYVMLQ